MRSLLPAAINSCRYAPTSNQNIFSYAVATADNRHLKEIIKLWTDVEQHHKYATI